MTVSAIAWVAHSSAMQRVYIRAIASSVKDKTGLDFGAEGLFINLFRGRFTLEGPYLAPGIFQAERIDIVADLGSFFWGVPRFRSIVVINPVSDFGLQQIEKIKIMESDGAGAKWIIEKIEVLNGNIIFCDPRWGRAEASFNIKGTGSESNKLRIDVDCPTTTVVTELATFQNHVNFQLDVEDNLLELRKITFDGELLNIQATGQIDTEKFFIRGSANGSLQSQYLSEIFGTKYSGISGNVNFETNFYGEIENPQWTFKSVANKIATPYHPIKTCDVEIEAHGTAFNIDIDKFNVFSGLSQLYLNGAINNSGCNLDFKGREVPFDFFSDISKSLIFNSISADIDGTFSSTLPVWNSGILNNNSLELLASLKNDGYSAGEIAFSATNNFVAIKSININTPEIAVSANGTVAFKPFLNDEGNIDFSLKSVDLSAKAITTAEQVAHSLDRWDVVDQLPIAGEVLAAAKIAWSHSRDLELVGNISLNDPVYFGATADYLAADVRIGSKQLFLDNIQLNRKNSSASGGLWLTWDEVPEGADQIRMRYESFGLPLSEGLDAGISDLGILEAMEAQGSVDGWVALEGPFDSIRLKGEAGLADGSIYGIRIPALTCEIAMDLAEQNFKLSVPKFRIADSQANLDSLSGQLGLEGSFVMDLTKETWAGNIFGQLDSHALGMESVPRLRANAEYVFDGPYACDYGAISLPEGVIKLSNGQIILDGGRSAGGFSGRIEITDNGQISGQVGLGNPELEMEPLVKLHAHKDLETTQCQLEIDFSPRTVDSERLIKTLSDGYFEDLTLKSVIDASLDAEGLSWRAKIDTFAGKVLGQDIGQQGASVIRSDPNGIRLELNLGSERLNEDDGDLPTYLNVNGTIPINSDQRADLYLDGYVDLWQVKETLAKVLDEPSETFLAGFTPRGKGELEGFWLYGPYMDLRLDGVFKVKGGHLDPPGTFPYGIENFNVELICSDRLIEVKQIEGRVLRGSLEASGKVAWDYEKKEENNYRIGINSYEIDTKLDNFQYNYEPEGFQFWGSLDSKFQNLPGQNRGEIKGTLTANNMEYVAEIDLGKMILNNAIRAIPSLRADLDDPLDSVNLNIDLVLRQPWNFNTNLLKVQGDNRVSERIKILGTLAKPGLRGVMELVPGGRLTNILPAGDIIIENGTIDFTDPNAINPVINIQGQVDITPFRVNLNVQGSVDSLNIVTTSTPTLRQDEIVTLLLNPASAQTLGNSAYRGNLSTASSTSGFAGTASGLITNLAVTSAVEQLRRALRFDRVSVAYRTGIGGVAETDVIVGKNIHVLNQTIPLAGSYKQSGDVLTIGGQMELRFGNLVIHLGASGSRALGVAPTGEIRYSWSTW